VAAGIAHGDLRCNHTPLPWASVVGFAAVAGVACVALVGRGWALRRPVPVAKKRGSTLPAPLLPAFPPPWRGFRLKRSIGPTAAVQERGLAPLPPVRRGLTARARRHFLEARQLPPSS